MASAAKTGRLALPFPVRRGLFVLLGILILVVKLIAAQLLPLGAPLSGDELRQLFAVGNLGMAN